MAVLKEDLFAVAPGEIYPRWFMAGEVVSGDIEAAARAQGKVADEKPARKAMKAPENK